MNEWRISECPGVLSYCVVWPGLLWLIISALCIIDNLHRPLDSVRDDTGALVVVRPGGFKGCALS